MSDSARSVPDRRPEGLEGWVTALVARAREADGAPPFSDQAMVDYRLGVRDLVAIAENAAALVTADEGEFVVAPEARGRGIGTALLDLLLARGVRLFWAHGDHPAARALAATRQLVAVRELLHLSRELPTSVELSRSNSTEVGNSRIETFRVGRDEDEWVAINAATFAHHREQGSVTRADLEQLEAEDWFRADNFLVLRRDGQLIGYCWLKVEGDRGEFYVVGVAPEHQGEKLGSLLFDAGLARLAELGIRSAHLYVEADNTPALALYRARGFDQDSIDIQYSVSF
jgi:mycothiol synthase